MPLHGPVLAAIALTDAADEVLAQASEMATSLGARLIVCHVVHESLRARLQVAHGDAQTAALTLEAQSREAVIVRARAATRLSAEAFDVAIESGSPHAGILRQAEKIGAGLVVVGPGPVADRVTRYSASAVLIARRSHGGVLAATDFSDPSLPAIAAAAAEAARRGVHLRVLHSVEAAEPIVLGSVALGVLPALPDHLVELLEAGARDRLRASLAKLGAAGDCVVAHGPAAYAIVTAAKKEPTALVVIGRRGRSNIARLLLGSEAETIIHTAPCSVLVVHLSN